ncbi:MAG: L-lactate permease [Trueperaceae bacterium]|nr:L-lactate permease [Trueperaceae bacterium]
MPSTLQALAAAAPLLVVIALMLGARWSAARAGLVGLAVALAAAWAAFCLGTRTLADLGALPAAGGALLEAAFLAATILWIVFPALAIHELQLRTGSVDVLRLAMGRLSGDPRIVALLVAWFFVLFVEGAAGFGTSVALAAPFLVSAGFKRVEAVAIALVGHAVGVSFGAVGTPILPQLAVTPYSGLELAGATAAYHALLGWLMPLAAMLMVTRAFPDAGGASAADGTDTAGGGVGRAVWGWTLFAAAAFLVPFTLVATFVGPELPTLVGSLAGGLAFVAALVAARRRTAGPMPAATPARDLLGAAAPYLALIALVLVTRLIPGVQAALAGAVVGWRLGPFQGEIAPLYHPGTMLTLGFALGALVQRARVTGSATASNVLFSDFQLATARTLGLDPLPLLGAQGFGAAVGNIICPHNIVAAAATVQLSGQEGAVLRRTLGVALGYALLGGLLARFVFT